MAKIPNPNPFVPLDPMDEATLARRRAAALVVVVAVWTFMWFRRRVQEARSITYGPMFERDQVRQKNLSFIYNSDDTHCVNLLRMKRAPFFGLCDLFRSRGLLRDSIHSCIEEQVAMFLHVVGHNQRFRVVDLTFRRSYETISRYFREVLYAVGELRHELIVPPATSVHPKILGSRRWYPYFKMPHMVLDSWDLANFEASRPPILVAGTPVQMASSGRNGPKKYGPKTPKKGFKI
ncbi:hypothetical protein EJB05_35931, partial [Eragrostis curvula]